MQQKHLQTGSNGRLYPALRAFASEMMDVGDGHQIYVEQSGTPSGIPVVVFHGGPGAGCSPPMRRYFNPERFRIILFDQRGCGRSLPHASVEHNTTGHLIQDIEHIRVALGVEKWLVFGGSWGSTLALLYAQSYPERVASLILRGIFLMTPEELHWFYGGGVARFWPDRWETFQSLIPEDERDDMIEAYHRRLFCGDEPTEIKFARAWAKWETALAALGADEIAWEVPPQHARAFARLENHYFRNGGFLHSENQIIRDIAAIEGIPGYIVQGRYDMVCPPLGSWKLAKAWPRANLRMIGRAGHALSEPAITATLVQIMDDIAQSPKPHGV